MHEVKDWVDEEYAGGRVTVLTDEELIKVIDDACGKLGISLNGGQKSAAGKLDR